MLFYTIGVYNSTENQFFEKLRTNQIDTFCDIRQRRGVRGAKYSFVNSKRLQSKLDVLGIDYKHILELAPTTEIREFQNKDDSTNLTLKRDRKTLGTVFTSNYKEKILRKFNFDSFIQKLAKNGAKRIVLFCVEEYPSACHRSLVAQKLDADHRFEVIHL